MTQGSTQILWALAFQLQLVGASSGSVDSNNLTNDTPAASFGLLQKLDEAYVGILSCETNLSEIVSNGVLFCAFSRADTDTRLDLLVYEWHHDNHGLTTHECQCSTTFDRRHHLQPLYSDGATPAGFHAKSVYREDS